MGDSGYIRMGWDSSSNRFNSILGIRCWIFSTTTSKEIVWHHSWWWFIRCYANRDEFEAICECIWNRWIALSFIWILNSIVISSCWQAAVACVIGYGNSSSLLPGQTIPPLCMISGPQVNMQPCWPSISITPCFCVVAAMADGVLLLVFATLSESLFTGPCALQIDSVPS